MIKMFLKNQPCSSVSLTGAIKRINLLLNENISYYHFIADSNFKTYYFIFIEHQLKNNFEIHRENIELLYVYKSNNKSCYSNCVS